MRTRSVRRLRWLASWATFAPSTTGVTPRSRTRRRLVWGRRRYRPALATHLATTQRYIDLAGVAFREEALIAEQRMFGVESGVETHPASTPETAV